MPRKLTCFDIIRKIELDKKLKEEEEEEETSSPSSGELTLILELDIPERNSITY